MKNKIKFSYIILSLLAGGVAGAEIYKYTYGKMLVELMAYKQAENVWYEAKYLELLKDGKIDTLQKAISVKVNLGIENKDSVIRHISEKQRAHVEDMYKDIEMSSNKRVKSASYGRWDLATRSAPYPSR